MCTWYKGISRCLCWRWNTFATPCCFGFDTWRSFVFFFRLQQGLCPNLHHYGGAARSSPSGSSAPSLASPGRTGSSSKLWACARNAASAARAVQRRVRAAPAASRAHGARSRARARASRRSSANACLSKRPLTSSPKTTKRQRPWPPGWSSGYVRSLRVLAC